MLEFFQGLFDVSDWPARWFCGYWSDFHGWLYIFSDIGIWLAYFIIPVIIIWFIQRRPDVEFLPVFWLFGSFILLCGMTHILDAIIFWWPAYRLSALIRFFTAIVSFITVFALIRDLPKLLNLSTVANIKKENEKLQILLRQKEDEIALLNRKIERQR
jgi:hypothetical protein